METLKKLNMCHKTHPLNTAPLTHKTITPSNSQKYPQTPKHLFRIWVVLCWIGCAVLGSPTDSYAHPKPHTNKYAPPPPPPTHTQV